MTPIDKLKRRAIGAVHDHRQVYLDPQAVLDLIAENERLRASIGETGAQIIPGSREAFFEATRKASAADCGARESVEIAGRIGDE